MNALIPPRGKELVVITVLRHPVHIEKDVTRVRSKAQLNMILSLPEIINRWRRVAEQSS